MILTEMHVQTYVMCDYCYVRELEGCLAIQSDETKYNINNA